MCHPVQCKTCKKVTWSGCGSHVAQVKAQVPEDNWCSGHPKTSAGDSDSWLKRLRRGSR